MFKDCFEANFGSHRTLETYARFAGLCNAKTHFKGKVRLVYKFYFAVIIYFTIYEKHK